MINLYHKDIATLYEGEQVDDLYLLIKKQIANTKNGKLYGAVKLGDATGEIKAKVWDQVEELLSPLAPGQVVRARGRVQVYNDNLQLVLSFLAADHKANFIQFLPKSPYDCNELCQKLANLQLLIKDNQLQQLLKTFFNNEAFRKIFEIIPAAKIAHHAYIHGLLEHTVTVASLAQSISINYPHLNIDLLITGALLHDIGKVEELTIGPPIDYTDVGRLEGHLVLGARMLDTKLIELKEFPTSMATILRHIILSHHGTEEFGSPIKPKIPEALVLHALDDLDAKMAMIRQLIITESDHNKETHWSNFHQLLERHILITPLLRNKKLIMPPLKTNFNITKKIEKQTSIQDKTHIPLFELCIPPKGID